MKISHDPPASFKAAVALAAIKGTQPVAALAERFGVTTQQVMQWEAELVGGAANAFADARTPGGFGGSVFDNKDLALTIAENSTQGFAMMDERGYCIYANRAWLQMTGYSAEEIAAKPLHDLVHHHYPDGRPYPLQDCPIDRALPENFDVRAHQDLFFRKDGSTFSVMCAASPIIEQGKPVATVIEIRDITERRQIEQRLQLIDRLGEATRGADDAKAVMAITTRLLGEHLGALRCAYADMEADQNRFTIRSDWSMPGVPSSVGVYSLELFGASIVAGLRAGRTMAIRDVDHELAPADGGDMFNSIGIKAAVCCPLVKSGRLLALMAVHQGEPRNWTAHDIALLEEVVERSWAHIERVRATEVLRDSQAHLSSLFEQTAAGICEADLGGCITNVNEHYCQILQRSRNDLVGSHLQDITHPDDLGRNLQLFQNMVQTGQSFALEKRYLRPDGSAVWVGVTVSLIRTGGDRPADSVLAVVVDISERKQIEEKLMEADRRKDEFLAMLAHELRNPLAPIMAAADLLRLAKLDEARVKHSSEVISRQARHMTSLIDDLLDVSRVTRGLVVLDQDELDAKRIVADAVEQVRPIIEARGHHLALHMPPDSTRVRGDKKRLVQILVNLLNNAAKYTPEGGNITLSLEAHGEQVKFIVTDNGIGMTPELTTRAFELFTQAERSSDRSQGGLGIGLALVKSLVELHGGAVNAHSAGLGKGSRFTVCLPRLNASTGADDARSGQAERQAPSRALKILVVDDNVDAAQTLAMYAEALGHEVIVEHGSHRALERARLERPDVCLLDVGLPEMNGNELARRLRSQTESAGATLIAITGYGQEQDRRNAIEAGFHHHFVKPVDTAMLASLLDAIGKA